MGAVDLAQPLKRFPSRSTWWCWSILLIVFFAYFYVSITFDPTEVADNMKKYGGFIPGIRAGESPRRSTSTTY